MKLRNKFILCFMAVVLVMVSLLYFYVNNTLSKRTMEEKAEDYSAFVQQLATSLRLVTREAEINLFNQYNSASLATVMLQQDNPYVKTTEIQSCLTRIPLNLSIVENVMVIDLDQNVYFAPDSLDDSKKKLLSVAREDLASDFTLWLTDEEGEIYIKKDVYQPFPLAYAGTLIAHVDKQQFLLALAINGHSTGMLALITEQGHPLVLHGGMNQELLDEALLQEPLSYLPVSREMEINGDAYWLTMHPAANQSWYVLQLMPMRVMMSLPIGLNQVLWWETVLVLLFALAACFVLTHSLTRNTSLLLAAMKEISRGNFDLPIPVVGRDEIGQLGEGIRWMQSELNRITADKIQHAIEKQNAEYEMLELKYRSLQSQISPHFICNILSSINALAFMGRTHEISTLAIKASRYLRENLDNADKKRIPLEHEVRFAEEYVDLYHEIYKNPCRFTASLSPGAKDCYVPNMLLQPLVENALVHGYPLDDPNKTHVISLSAKMEGPDLILLLSDNGQGMSPEQIEQISQADANLERTRKLKGFGLRGVLQRLHLLYADNHSFQISSTPGVMTLITIRIPCQNEGG